jgi:hypothetical protein
MVVIIYSQGLKCIISCFYGFGIFLLKVLISSDDFAFVSKLAFFLATFNILSLFYNFGILIIIGYGKVLF